MHFSKMNEDLRYSRNILLPSYYISIPLFTASHVVKKRKTKKILNKFILCVVGQNCCMKSF